jgi:hypothetical protein
MSLATQEVDAFARCVGGRARERGSEDRPVVETLSRLRELGQPVIAVFIGDTVQYVSFGPKRIGRTSQIH